MRLSFEVVVSASAGGFGFASGTPLGQMGIWVWPGAGCQAVEEGVWPYATFDTNEAAESRRIIRTRRFIRAASERLDFSA